jgi:hypothetical protein
MMMSNQHRDRPLSVRPPNESRIAAQAALTEYSWEMTEYITAALDAVATDPAATLAHLEPYRPPAKPRGRPRKKERGPA